MNKLLLTLFVTGMFTTAQAATVKNYPAASCAIVPGYSTEYVISHTFGYILNDSIELPLKVICPLVRDSTGGNLSTDVSVYVIDNHSTENVRCNIYKGRYDARSAGGATRYSSGADYENAQQLRFTNWGLEEATRTLYLSCELPPREEIQGWTPGSSVQSYTGATE